MFPFLMVSVLALEVIEGPILTKSSLKHSEIILESMTQS